MSNVWDMIGEHSTGMSEFLSAAGSRMSAMSRSSFDSNIANESSASDELSGIDVQTPQRDAERITSGAEDEESQAEEGEPTASEGIGGKAWYKDLSALKLKDLLDSPTINSSSKSQQNKPQATSMGWKDIMSGSSASDWYGNLSDRLVERIMYTALPSASDNMVGAGSRVKYQKLRPQLSIPLASKNFSRMTSRMGFIYELYYSIVSFISWENHAFTLSILILYSYICLHPRVIVTLPFLLTAYCVLSPAYATRHPPEPHSLEYYNVLSEGQPLCRAPVPRPVPELSREFFMNVVDTQNLMAQFSDVYDFCVSKLELFAFFADESRSSMTFISCLIAAIVLYTIAPFLLILPWRTISLSMGWLALGALYFICSDYRGKLRTVAVLTKEKEKERKEQDSKEPTGAKPQEASKNSKPNAKNTIERNANASIAKSTDAITNHWAFQRFDHISHEEFPFDEPLETREVEIFEYQTYEIESHRWSSSLYTTDPQILRRFLNSDLQAKFPVTGVLYLNELLPPKGWDFTPGSKWTLDYWAEHWVETRRLSHLVTVDAGEKWVYDSQDGGEKVLNWRRRRWHRDCTRQQKANDSPVSSVATKEDKKDKKQPELKEDKKVKDLSTTNVLKKTSSSISQQHSKTPSQ